jgi:hypothetical protein
MAQASEFAQLRRIAQVAHHRLGQQHLSSAGQQPVEGFEIHLVFAVLSSSLFG